MATGWRHYQLAVEALSAADREKDSAASARLRDEASVHAALAQAAANVLTALGTDDSETIMGWRKATQG